MASRIESFWNSSKPKPGEEGVLGPIDTFNRASYRWSKPAAMLSGVAVLASIPLAGLALVATGAWAGSDKLQIEGSKWARRKLRGEMKPGQEIKIAK